MKKWVVRFRVVSPTDIHVPGIYIPVEETLVIAETADSAWKKMLDRFALVPPDWFIKADIEEKV